MKFLSKQDEETLSQIARWWRSNKNALDRVGIQPPRSKAPKKPKIFSQSNDGDLAGWSINSSVANNNSTIATWGWWRSGFTSRNLKEGYSIEQSSVSAPAPDKCIGQIESGSARPVVLKTDRVFVVHFDYTYVFQTTYENISIDPDFYWYPELYFDVTVGNNYNGSGTPATVDYRADYAIVPRVYVPTTISSSELPFITRTIKISGRAIVHGECWLQHRLREDTNNFGTAYIAHARLLFWPLTSGPSGVINPNIFNGTTLTA